MDGAMRAVDEAIPHHMGDPTAIDDPQGIMDLADVEFGAVDVPDIFGDAQRMLAASYFMFVLPDMRALIKLNELNKGEEETLRRFVELPCSLQDVLDIYRANWERVKEYAGDRAQMYLIFFENIHDSTELEQIQILALEDQKAEEDCVYMLLVNHAAKRIIVAFRGSVTRKDFVQDVKALPAAVENPFTEPASFLVHLGFKEYLYGVGESLLKALPKLSVGTTEFSVPGVKGAVPVPSLKNNKEIAEEVEKPKKKYQIILDQVLNVSKDLPDYKLYVTGHSLGGALATVFSLEAAVADEVPKPVTCITSGAPKAGNLAFLRAFEKLEDEKKLRCLRVANYRDIVTLSPPSACCMIPLRFRHVGFRLKLMPYGFQISYPPKVKSCFSLWLFDFMKGVRQFSMVLLSLLPFILFSWRVKKYWRAEHTQLVYSSRFMQHREILSQFTLDDLYEIKERQRLWRIPLIDLEQEAGKERRKPFRTPDKFTDLLPHLNQWTDTSGLTGAQGKETKAKEPKE